MSCRCGGDDIMRQPKDSKDFRFTDLLDPNFFKRGPGKPRLPSWDDILPSWESIYGADAWYGPGPPQRGGRPAKQARNQSLLEGWAVAKRQGTAKRAFVRKWIRQWHGRKATLDEVRTVERQIDRLLKK